MPTAVETQSSSAPKTRRRSRSFSDRRRGRSRSPGAYLRKKGKSLRGFLKARSSRRLEGAKKPVPSKSAPPKAEPTATEPPAAVTPSPVEEEEEAAVYDVEIDAVASEGIKTTSSDTDAEVNDSEKKDTVSTASKTSETDSQDPTQAPGVKTEETLSNTVQIVLLLIDPTSRRFELIQLEFDSVKAIVQDLLSQIPSAASEESVRDQGYDGICTIDGEEMSCTGKLKDFVEQNEGINAVVLAMPEGVSPEDCAEMAKPILADKNVIAVVDPSGKTQSLSSSDGIAEDSAEQKSEATTDGADESTPAVTEDEESRKEVIKGTLSKKMQHVLGAIHSLDVDTLPVPILIVLGMSMFFVPVLAFIFYRHHSMISAPFSTGDIITPGVTRSQCGLFGKVPFVKLCEPKSVSFDEDGVLSLYHGNEVQWQMKGGKCDDSGEVECIVKISEDGNVMIAGKKARMEGNTADEISPWPFADEVSVKKKLVLI
eukprot:CAMPEP_0172481004 /NCGR_PEP_ID=MMETSP1066-20121228/6513_1 /TAXON_ID=671091 /ORGANISM="Coscinodiscus wailesii, Strain CCMP2513" /LENGTH=483 /DNA_ID=CAMNT_0013242865 /DNA_START=114 /DNA_END=1565 /DNA_ORIENTATION=+